tara:strand:+ start:1436 stop:1804 length:369 start_codon:yes stop_codon:yes gene_type:complete
MINYWIVLGSIFGFLTIALGAFGAHGLKNILINNETTDIYNKAVLYQMFHTLILLFLGLYQELGKNIHMLTGLSFVLGILIFSGSLYILSITNIKWLGAITPIGGLFFLTGWISLFIYSIKL